MLKDILNVKSVKKLTKEEQKQTKGRGGISTTIGYVIGTGPIGNIERNYECYKNYTSPWLFSHYSTTDDSAKDITCYKTGYYYD